MSWFKTLYDVHAQERRIIRPFYIGHAQCSHLGSPVKICRGRKLLQKYKMSSHSKDAYWFLFLLWLRWSACRGEWSKEDILPGRGRGKQRNPHSSKSRSCLPLDFSLLSSPNSSLSTKEMLWNCGVDSRILSPFYKKMWDLSWSVF